MLYAPQPVNDIVLYPELMPHGEIRRIKYRFTKKQARALCTGIALSFVFLLLLMVIIIYYVKLYANIAPK